MWGAILRISRKDLRVITFESSFVLDRFLLLINRIPSGTIVIVDQDQLLYFFKVYLSPERSSNTSLCFNQLRSIYWTLPCAISCLLSINKSSKVQQSKSLSVAPVFSFPFHVYPFGPQYICFFFFLFFKKKYSQSCFFVFFIFWAKRLTCHRNKDNGIWQGEQMLYVGIGVSHP